MKKVLSHLTFYVFIAIIAAIALGVFAPTTAVKMKFLGSYFVELIKIFIIPIIFFTIVLGIASMGNLKKVGRIGIKSIIYFEVVTTLSLLIGMGIGLLLKPGYMNKGSIMAVPSNTAVTHSSFNWISFLQSNTTIQALIVAIIAGIIINRHKGRVKILHYLGKISHYVFAALKYVMYLAPIGAFGGMAFTVGKFGLNTLLPLAKLVACVYGASLFFVIVVLGSILKYYGLSIWQYLANIKEEILLVLGTSSSEVALPAMMFKLEKMGCSKTVVGLVVPTGYSFNLDGTSIYLSMAVIFIAQLYHVHLSLSHLFMLILVLMLTSKGAAGVTGSGFIVLTTTLTAMHTIPVEGLAFLLGVDKFMSEARAITNLIGNGVATIVIAKNEQEFIKQIA
ncbi:MAG: cation:dicarboxylase symporter family transporter [Bacteroidota bacterium]|nr:cation:dicarboxylase symporter family transporter [Bacteroidota bacterium]